MEKMQKFKKNFFTNVVKKLKILEYQKVDSFANDISHPMFKTIMNLRNHSSITAINNLNHD